MKEKEAVRKGAEREGKSGALAAVAVLGWEVCAGLVRGVGRIFLEKAHRVEDGPGAGEAGSGAKGEVGEAMERESAEEERRKAEAGAVLLLGGVVGWKLAKRAARKVGEWLLSERRGPRGGAGAGGGATIEGGFVAGRRAESEGEGSQPAAMSAAEQAKKEREEDRNLDAERGVDRERRNRWATGVTGLAFLAAAVGGIGFLVTYWMGGRNEWLGASLGLFFGAAGVGAVGWGRWLTVQKEATEKREQPSSREEHDAAVVTFEEGAGDIQRRKLLLWVGAGGMGLVGAMVISLFRSLGGSPNDALYTRVWKRGQRLMTLDNKPVRADALAPGSMTLVFPEDSIGSEKTQTVLVRVNPALLELPAGRTGWAPMGNLAYSRVCTHAGCSVGMYETTTHMLMCPCHQSTFDVLRGAMPTGGPAARPLPQLPLYTDSEGYLRAADGFTKPPGPGFWGIPS